MTELLSIRHEPGRVVVQLSQHIDSIREIRELLLQLGLNRAAANKILSPLGGPDENYSKRRYRRGLYEDRWFEWKFGSYDVEVFFGSKRATLVVRSVAEGGIGKVLDFFRSYRRPKSEPMEPPRESNRS